MVLKNRKKIYKFSKNKVLYYSFDSYVDQKLFNIALKFIKLIKRVGALESYYKNLGENRECEILLFKNKIDK